MKLSEQTLDVLKKFAELNTKFKAKAGNVIFSMSEGNSAVAKAEIPDTFPVDFAIHDMNQFLSIIGIFDEPEFDFGKTNVVIGSDSSAYKYNYCDPSVVKLKENVRMPAIVANATVSQVMFDKLKKASAITSNKDVCFTAKAGKAVFIELKNKKNDESDLFNQQVGAKSDKTFCFNFKIDNLQHFFPGDYEVEFAEKGLAHFKNTKHPIEYWVAIESDSVFGE